MTLSTMIPAPNTQGEASLEEMWFVEAAPASEPPPASEDPELDSDWFARGRPLSSRPPPVDTDV